MALERQTQPSLSCIFCLVKPRTKTVKGRQATEMGEKRPRKGRYLL